MSDVFISYSRRDTEFVKVLKQALEQSAYETWIDWADIPKSADWWREIEGGIEAADAFIFVISPDSVNSKVCRDEVDHAVRHNKRLIPIVRREDFDPNTVHPTISRHNWLFFRDEDNFDEAFEVLVDTINTDLAHAREHTRLLVRALEWERKNYDSSFLITGTALESAEQWLITSVDKAPHPIQLQRDYIHASKQLRQQSQLFEASYKTLTQQLKDAFIYRRLKLRTVFITSLLVAIVVVGLRFLFLQPAELAAYDGFMRLRPGEGPDERISIISISGSDIDAQIQRGEPFTASASLSDQSLSRLLSTLREYQPRLIGLDIYRSIGTADPVLAQQLSSNENLVTVCKVKDVDSDGRIIPESSGVAAPPEVPIERVGFSDFVDDADTVVRRHLMHMNLQIYGTGFVCPSEQAFSVVLARRYIEQETGSEVAYQNPFQQEDAVLRINGREFPRVHGLTGGYQGVSSGGYQTMLNYRTNRDGRLQNVFEQFTLEQLFDGHIPVEALRDRIVLVGVIDTATTPDYWSTPFGTGNSQIAGVVLQGQMTSQIISAVLDGRSLLWSLSEITEMSWMVLWAMIAGFLTWRCRKVTKLAAVITIAIAGLWVMCFVAFVYASCWLPVVPVAIAMLLTTGSILYQAYRPSPSESVKLPQQQEVLLSR